MTPQIAKLLKRAALLLEEDAKASFESCRTNAGPWNCHDCRQKPYCDSRVSYDERVALANALRSEAA